MNSLPRLNSAIDFPLARQSLTRALHSSRFSMRISMWRGEDRRKMGLMYRLPIYRLVMEGSIEEKILALHADKRDMADRLLEGTGSAGSLSLDELMGLLGEVSGGAVMGSAVAEGALS